MPANPDFPRNWFQLAHMYRVEKKNIKNYIGFLLHKVNDYSKLGS